MSIEVWLWGAAAIGSTIGLGYLGNRVMLARMKRRWKQLADELGLARERAFWYLHGRHQDLFLEVLRVGDSWFADVTVSGAAALALSIQPRTPADPQAEPFEPDFDRRYAVHGDPVQALALLGHELRRSWILAAARGFALQGDERGWRLSARISMELTSLLRPVVMNALELGAQLARGIAPITSIPDRRPLAQALIARLSDPSALVRARAARTLAAHREIDPAVDLALTHALDDTEPSVRFEAALVLGRADILAGLALATDASTAVRLGAFRRAVALAPREAMTLTMVRAWALGSDNERRLEALAVLPRVDDDLEDLALEVLTEVERDPDQTALVDLFTLLATHGSARSVTRLLPYRDRFFDSPLKVLARDTILAIQSRAGGSTGALSLADGGGGLSEPE